MQPNEPPLPIEIAKLIQLDFPAECLVGIEANLELMQYHARILDNYLTKLNTSALAANAPVNMEVTAKTKVSE